jgi:Bacterial Ig-like domain
MQYRNGKASVCRARWVPRGVTAAIVLCATGWGVHAVSHPVTEAAVQSPRATVRPLFDLRSPERSPFPSDVFTVADGSQNTGRRVNLPTPHDCVTHASDCEDVALLNHLDGFNMQARISIPFDGDIDPSTVSSRNIFLVKLRDALSGRTNDNSTVGINYIVWDPITREVSFRPAESLEQHTTYALVVTTGVRDSSGNAIGAVESVAGIANAEYRRAVERAAPIVQRVAALDSGRKVAALSVFTTQTFSHIFERMRDAIAKAPAPLLDFKVGPNGSPAVFDIATVQSLTVNAHASVQGPLNPQPLPNAVRNLHLLPDSVGRLAFGNLRALDFTIHPSGHLPMIPTRTGTLPAPRSMYVAFNLWLPAAAQPRNGWPVVVCGPGSQSDKNACNSLASVFAAQGVAVIGLNHMGHGYGPRTTTTVTRTDGSSATVSTPGSGYDADGNGTIDIWEPRFAPRPSALHGTAGSALQSAAFVLQLVRAIRAGADIDGDGRRELDPTRIYYVGQSYGAIYGMFAFVYEPAIRAAAFAAGGGTLAENRRLSPPARRMFATALAARTPSLINENGLTSLDGMPVTGPHFNENLPLRNQPPAVTPAAGARAIQQVIDRVTWVEQIASSVAIAPFLRHSPPAGSSARPFVLQFARSDVSSPNPVSMEIVRAGRFADRTHLYRHDLNVGDPGVANYPHLYLLTVQTPPNFARVALGAQRQIATFFASDGKTVIHPEPRELWESPIATPLPEDLYFLPRRSDAR